MTDPQLASAARLADAQVHTFAAFLTARAQAERAWDTLRFIVEGGECWTDDCESYPDRPEAWCVHCAAEVTLAAEMFGQGYQP